MYSPTKNPTINWQGVRAEYFCESAGNQDKNFILKYLEKSEKGIYLTISKVVITNPLIENNGRLNRVKQFSSNCIDCANRTVARKMNGKIYQYNYISKMFYIGGTYEGAEFGCVETVKVRQIIHITVNFRRMQKSTRYTNQRRFMTIIISL